MLISAAETELSSTAAAGQYSANLDRPRAKLRRSEPVVASTYIHTAVEDVCSVQIAVYVLEQLLRLSITPPQQQTETCEHVSYLLYGTLY